MCSPSFTAITSGRDSVQQARQLKCRLVAPSDGCRNAAILSLTEGKRTSCGHRKYVAFDPEQTSLPYSLLIPP